MGLLRLHVNPFDYTIMGIYSPPARTSCPSTCGCSSAGCSSSTGSCSPWPGSSPHRKTWPRPARSISTCGWASACSSSRRSSSPGGGSARSAVTSRRPTRPGPGHDRPGQAEVPAYPDSESGSSDSDVQGGPVDELLGVPVERPALDQLQVEVGRTAEDRVQPGLTGDHREERHLHAVD